MFGEIGTVDSSEKMGAQFMHVGIAQSFHLTNRLLPVIHVKRTSAKVISRSGLERFARI